MIAGDELEYLAAEFYRLTDELREARMALAAVTAEIEGVFVGRRLKTWRSADGHIEISLNGGEISIHILR